MEAYPTNTGANSEISGFWRPVGLMAEISAMCSLSTSDQPPYQEVLRLVRKIVPFDAATLYIFNHKQKKFEARTSLDGRLDMPGLFTLRESESRPTWSATDKKPLLISPAAGQQLPESISQYESILSAPLVSGDELMGVLNIGCRRARAFDDNDITLMSIVADLFAAATERRYYKERESLLNQALVRVGHDAGRVQKNSEARERLELAAELVASIHHQINNPLAVIVGNVQCLLIEKEAMDEKALSRLKMIEKAALKVSKVNRNLLNVNSLAREPMGDAADDDHGIESD